MSNRDEIPWEPALVLAMLLSLASLKQMFFFHLPSPDNIYIVSRSPVFPVGVSFISTWSIAYITELQRFIFSHSRTQNSGQPGDLNSSRGRSRVRVGLTGPK